jgi:hypothetical protein
MKLISQHKINRFGDEERIYENEKGKKIVMVLCPAIAGLDTCHTVFTEKVIKEE